MTDPDKVCLDRTVTNFTPDSLAQYQNSVVRIKDFISHEEVLIAYVDTAKTARVYLSDLSAFHDETQADKINLNIDKSEIKDEHWNVALFRFNVIKPFIHASTEEQVKEAANQIGVHHTTVYKWLATYRQNRSILALIPKSRGWQKNKPRLPSKLEIVIQEAIEKQYLSHQKLSIAEIYSIIEQQCNLLGIHKPSEATVRRKINALSNFVKVKHREGRKAADDQYGKAAYEFPYADFPLSHIQIDHTKMDIEIVDEEHRLTIGRPYITLAIDIYTRMITGYYLSLDPPSTASVGICIANSINPKKPKLIELEIQGEWTIQGIMNTIHTDNGADFRTESLQRSCLNYGINWEFRPIGGAKFGGHIERLIGTMNIQTKRIDGSTYSNIREKGTYDSENHAALTLRELEYYLVYWIINVYHKQMHSGIGMSPEQKWDEWLWGKSGAAAGGLQRINNPETIYLDFLPDFQTTIQRYGVKKDNISYYANSLQSFIKEMDPITHKHKKFTFKRDPRDISFVWFYEPNIKQYLKIPSTKKELPPVSLWEHRQVLKHLKEHYQGQIDMDAICDALHHLRQHVATSRTLTKNQRRQNQRRIESSKQIPSIQNQNSQTTTSNQSDSYHTNIHNDLWSKPLTPFDDLKEANNNE